MSKEDIRNLAADAEKAETVEKMPVDEAELEDVAGGGDDSYVRPCFPLVSDIDPTKQATACIGSSSETRVIKCGLGALGY